MGGFTLLARNGGGCICIHQTSFCLTAKGLIGLEELGSSCCGVEEVWRNRSAAGDRGRCPILETLSTRITVTMFPSQRGVGVGGGWKPPQSLRRGSLTQEDAEEMQTVVKRSPVQIRF